MTENTAINDPKTIKSKEFVTPPKRVRKIDPWTCEDIRAAIEEALDAIYVLFREPGAAKRLTGALRKLTTIYKEATTS